MGDIDSHLTSWEAAGVIDGVTAGRIRSWESDAARRAGDRGLPAIASIFGPGIAIGEMFAYLGALFLLAASDLFLVRIAGNRPDEDVIYAIGAAIQSAALAGIGVWLRGGDARRRRAAGVAFLFAVAHVAATGEFLAEAVGLIGAMRMIVATIAALLAALAARRFHPSLTTQAALVVAVSGVSLAIQDWARETWFVGTTTAGPTPAPEGDPLILALASAVAWLVTAVVIGAIGLYEAGTIGRDPRAVWRAGLSRFWAGLVAIAGVATALTRSDLLLDGTYGRVIEPWVADVAILFVAVALIERAMRRDDAAFVIPAAIGMITALTDFNFSYLADNTEVGLLIEGLILLAVGFVADRIRRRLGRRGEDANREPPAGTPAGSDQPVEAPAES